MKRPVGVWIIGVLALIGAILRILAGITALGVTGLSMAGEFGDGSGQLTSKALGVGITMLAIGIIYLIFSVSFLGLQTWSWIAMLYIEFFVIIAVIAQFIFGGWHWASLISIILPLIIIYYLTRPQVSEKFSQ